MKKDPNQPDGTVELRHRAEERLKTRTPETKDENSPLQTLRVLHELQVHQIELEMQNEELRESRTQIEAALERATELYDFAPVGYFTFSSDGIIQKVNLPGARLLGQERSRLVGRHFATYVSKDTGSIFHSWLKEVFTTNAKQTSEIVLFRESQPPLAIEIEATPSPDGREARAVAIDITSRKALEEQLRQAQKMEVIGQLAGGVAHDFNNILAAVILNLDMLRIQLELPPEAQLPLQNIEGLTKRATSLTRQLLLFSRQQALHLEHLEINATLANLFKMLERLLGENITCLLPASSQELWVDVDASMLDQTVMNICINARDAMPNGGTIVLESSLMEFSGGRSSANPEARDGKFACLRISDTGCGMDAEVLKHAFEPFFTTKDIGKGTGLGLASAYGVMHQHKGWVRVESVVGQGTSFYLYFPLAEKAGIAHAMIPQRNLAKGRNETILVVEDEAALLLVSTRALAMLGYQVLSATNGPEALMVWAEHRDRIDLVITDMRMPRELTGLELAQELWKSKPSLKIIIMSGYSIEMTQNSTSGEQHYTFLAKPFDVKILSETVKKCLA